MNRREFVRLAGFSVCVPSLTQERTSVMEFVQCGIYKLKAHIATDHSLWRFTYLILPDDKYDMLQNEEGHRGPFIIPVNMVNKSNIYTSDIVLKPQSVSGKGHLLIDDKWLFEVVQLEISDEAQSRLSRFRLPTNLELPVFPTLEYLQSQNKNIRSISVGYSNDWTASVSYGEKRPPRPFYVNYQTALLVYSGSWITVEQYRLKPPYYNKQIPWPDWLPHF